MYFLHFFFVRMVVCVLMAPVMVGQSNGCCLWFMKKVCCCFKQNNNNRFVIHTYDSDEESSDVASAIYPPTAMTSTDSCIPSSYNETNDVFYFNHPHQLDPYESDFRDRGLTLKFQIETAQSKANKKAAEERIKSALSQVEDTIKKKQGYMQTFDQARNAYRYAETQVEARRREHEEGSFFGLGATPESGRHSTVDLKKMLRESETQMAHALRQSLALDEELQETINPLNDGFRQRDQASSKLETVKKEKKEYDIKKAKKEGEEIAQEIEKMIQSSKKSENEYYDNEIIRSSQKERNILSFIDDDKSLF